MAFQAFRNCEYNTQLYNSVNESCKDENPTILRIDLASLGYIIAFRIGYKPKHNATKRGRFVEQWKHDRIASLKKERNAQKIAPGVAESGCGLGRRAKRGAPTHRPWSERRENR